MRRLRRSRGPAGGGRPLRRRDRHGRGVRGPLAGAEVPYPPSRAARFDDLVLDAVERLERDFAAELAQVELVVEEVPPTSTEPVPLGRADAATLGRSARIIVYRRPVELRAPDSSDRAGLVHAVVVEQLAELLGLAPEQVDPDYGG